MTSIVEAFTAFATSHPECDDHWETFYSSTQSGACNKAWEHVKRAGQGVVVHNGRIVAFLWPAGSPRHQAAVERGECKKGRRYWAVQGFLISENTLRPPKESEAAHAL